MTVTADDYLEALRPRFAVAGFRCREGVRFRWQHFHLVTDKTRFDLVGAPTTLREVFVFTRFAELDAARLKEFAAECWRFAESERGPPRLLGKLLGENLCVYAIALVDRPGEDALEAARDELPSNHFQVGWEIPLVYDARTGLLNHFCKAPLLGGAFCTEFKKVIAKRLAPPT